MTRPLLTLLALLLPAVASAQYPLGASHYYDCEGASGATLLDKIGTAHGTNNGTVGSGAGIIGNGRTFNGNAANYIDLGTNYGLGATSGGAFSIAFWAKPNNLTTQVWVGRLNGGAAKVHDLDLVSSTWRHATGIGPSFDIVSSGVVSAGGWFHVAGIYTATGTTKLFINGVEAGTADTAPTGAFTDSLALYVGKRAGDNAGPVNGTIDEMIVYPYVLSDAQVAALHGGGNPIAYPLFTSQVILIQ